MYTIMVFINPCIVLCYWGLVHDEHLEELRTKHPNDPNLLNQRIFHTVIVHSIPGLCAVALVVVSDCVLIRHHWRALAVIGFLYSYSNYRSVMASGKPLYGFMPWNDGLRTPCICVIIVSFFIGLFYCSALLDEKLTKRSSDLGKLIKSATKST